MPHKNVILKYCLIVGVLCTLTSCAHVYYSPNAHNVPLLREKKEKVLSAAVGSGINEVDFGVDVQAAYALTNRIGIIGNYYRASGGQANNTEPEGGYGHLLEGGVGYFKPLKQDLSFEVFGGAGKGKVFNYFDEYKTSTSEMYFTRYFVQPNFGWKHKNLDVAISSRFAWLTYDKIQVSNYGQVTNPSYFRSVEQSRRYFLIEPAVTFRAGLRYMKAQLQVGLSHNQSDPIFSQETVNVNLGFQFDWWSQSRRKD